MAAIKLKAEQIGKVTGEKETTRHEFPALDIFGNTYDRRAASTRYVAKNTFVVIPPGQDSDDLTFDLSEVMPSSATKSSKPESEGKA